MPLRAPSTPLRPDRRKEVLSECAPLKMPPVHKGFPETAAGLRNAVANTGRQRWSGPPLTLRPATRSPAGVPCARNWRCPVAHCEPADRHDREHAARRKIGTPWLFAYSNSTDQRKRIFTNRFPRSHRISLNGFTFQLLVCNVSSPSGKLFGGRSAATPESTRSLRSQRSPKTTRSLRSQRCDFVDLAQNGFCIRLVAHQGYDLVLTRPPLQGSFEHHFATSPTVSRLRINPPSSF